MGRFAVAVLMAGATCVPTAAQSTASRESIDWAVSLAQRYVRMRGPAVSAHSLATLGALVCPHDQDQGEKLFRAAMERANDLPDGVFDYEDDLQPVATLRGLSDFIWGAAADCNPDLRRIRRSSRLRTQLAYEREQINTRVARAAGLASENPYRAAQLLEGALSLGRPDAGLVAGALSELRLTAPELADNLYPIALDLAMPPSEQSIGTLNQLGTYLFGSVTNGLRTMPLGLATIVDFSCLRPEANPADVAPFLSVVSQVVNRQGLRVYDPLVSYALVWQMQRRAQEYAPEMAPALESSVAALGQLVGDDEGLVRQFLGQGGELDPVAADVSRHNAQAVAEVFAAARDGNFPIARHLANQMTGGDLQRNVRELVSFAEAVDALEGRRANAAYAAGIARQMHSPVKRSLIYTGALAASRTNMDERIGAVIADFEDLPPRHRAAVMTALAARVVRRDSHRALSIFSDAVDDLNRAREKSLRDPDSGDASRIVCGATGCFEVIDTGVSRMRYSLDVPRVEPFTLPAAIEPLLEYIDYRTLAGVLSELEEETYQEVGLNTLAGALLNGQ